MSQDAQVRARVLGKQRKALSVSWTLDVRGQRFRCVVGTVDAVFGQTCQLEVRGQRGWKTHEVFAETPDKLLAKLANGWLVTADKL